MNAIPYSITVELDDLGVLAPFEDGDDPLETLLNGALSVLFEETTIAVGERTLTLHELFHAVRDGEGAQHLRAVVLEHVETFDPDHPIGA